MEELIKKTAEDLKGLFVDFKSIRGFQGAKAAAPRIIAHVNELKSLHGLNGEQAKELAIGLTLELVPLPTWMPTFAARWILDKIIEQAYQLYKKTTKP